MMKHHVSDVLCYEQMNKEHVIILPTQSDIPKTEQVHNKN